MMACWRLLGLVLLSPSLVVSGALVHEQQAAATPALAETSAAVSLYEALWNLTYPLTTKSSWRSAILTRDCG
jgi:hypothetical protein